MKPCPTALLLRNCCQSEIVRTKRRELEGTWWSWVRARKVVDSTSATICLTRAVLLLTGRRCWMDDMNMRTSLNVGRLAHLLWTGDTTCPTRALHNLKVCAKAVWCAWTVCPSGLSGWTQVPLLKSHSCCLKRFMAMRNRL